MRRLLAATAFALLLVTAPASARVATPLEYDGFIDGSDAVGVSSPNLNGIEKTQVDEATGTIYATSSEEGGRIYKFDPTTRLSSPFSELATNSVIAPQFSSGFAIDNSGTASQGRIYSFPEFAPQVTVFKPGGTKDESVTFSAQGDDCGAVVGPDGHLWISIFHFGAFEYLPNGQKTGRRFVPDKARWEHEQTIPVCDFAIDSQGNFYAPESYQGGFVKKYNSNGVFQYALGTGHSNVVAIDRRDDSVYVNDGTVVEEYAANGSLLDEFATPEASTAPCPSIVEEAGECYDGIQGSQGIAVDETSGNVYVTNSSFRGNRIDIFKPGTPRVVADANTDLPVPTPTTALLRGTLNPDGVATTVCKFEWGVGSSGAYEHDVPCVEGQAFNGSTDQHVTAEISGLKLGAEYHERLFVENAGGYVSTGLNQVFTGQGKPILGKAFVNELNTDGARLNAEIDPNGGRTTYRFEYGTNSSYGTVVPLEGASVPDEMTVGDLLKGLEPGTEYHYRVVATDLAGESPGADHTFRTFPQIPVIIDKCGNALSRQQTGAALMPDCRSYELASALDSGGYNVESDLVPGQQPLNGPTVDGRLLYGVHNGGIPGTGNPTNHGVDPYLAVRGPNGWTTKYIGVPSNGTPSATPFASSLLATDEAFDSFAFGGPDICSPCFADGSSGIPVRGQNGTLVQGMEGDPMPDGSVANDGLIMQPMSADGKHLVFGSTAQFAEGGNDETGDVSIYERDLVSGSTQVVSRDPGAANLTCVQGTGTCHSPGNADGIAELAISRDGSRVVVARRISTDPDGNRYWHPYMHVGSSPQTIDLAPGTTSGVLFDGMTADGSRVFLTTRDQLSPEDTDSSADIYVDEIGGDGPVTPALVSVGEDGPSNSDDCDPVSEWNTVSGGPGCDAVAFAGGAGVAADEGSFYFVTPELLDGPSNGVENQANLYLVRPGGTPHFVTTMDTSVGKPGPAPPSRPVVKSNFLSELAFPDAITVDQNSGDVYVVERSAQVVSRYTSTGAPHPFTAGPGAGTNHLPGENLSFGTGENQIGVDSHTGSPFENALYVTSNSSTISVIANTGAKLGTIGGFSEACGVAVDQANGDVYVADYYGSLSRLHPVSNSKPNFEENYERTQVQTRAAEASLSPCQVTADAGDVFASGWNTGPVLAYEASQFEPAPGPQIYGEPVSTLGNTMAMDPSTNELLIDIGGRIDLYGPSGKFEEELGKGEIAGSRGVTVNGSNHHIYAVTGNSVIELGYQVHDYEPIDNPAILHGVRESGNRRFGDFQVSPDGHYVAFPSAAPITSFDSFNHLEVYRYDADAGSMICASCAPTNSKATADASMPPHGNALTADGRVFFSSKEPLVLRDTNGNQDAYEWKGGEVFLISSGTSPFDEGMLSVSKSGRDAYFFTREKLAPEDGNGSLMRIYDAREDGGFFHVPEAPPCAASDECHGPGSQAAAPSEISSLGGTEGNLVDQTPPKGCKPGFVKKHGNCVKKSKKKKKKIHKRNNKGVRR